MTEEKDNKTILIVEDDPLSMRLTVDLLKINGFNTLSCSDGNSALETLKNIIPDLILLDIMMPGVDGTQLHERLSKDARTSGIKVVFLTSLVKEEEVAESGGNIGGLDYISKSTAKDKFVKRIKEILSGKKMEDL